MKLNQLKDLLLVAQKRSLRAAARERDTTQPAMSRSIQELERELGVVLFERQPQGVTLTPMGERFVHRASAAMAELQRARDELAQLMGESTGSVVACLSAGAQARLLPQALDPFRQRYPGVQLQLKEGLYPMVEGALKDGNIDFFIGPEPPNGIDSGLLSESMYDNPLVIVGRVGHPLSEATTIEALHSAQWLGATMTRQVDNLERLFAQRGLQPPRPALLCETTHTLILALRHSNLLALVPESLLHLGAAEGLCAIRVEDRMHGPAAVLIRRAGMPMTPAAEYLCDMLRRANEYRTRDGTAPIEQPAPMA